MIYHILLVVLLLEAVVAFWKPQYAIGICLAIISLFPPALAFNVGINLNSFNLAIIVLVVSLIATVRTKKCIYPNVSKIIRNYVIFVALSSVICAFIYITLGEYIQNMILLLMEYGLLAYVMCWMKMGEKEIKVFNMILFILAFIIIIYGFINYQMKINPYIAYVCLLTDAEDMSNSFMLEQRGILDGRISSVFQHPLHLGQWILMVFAYVFYEFRNIINKFIYYIFLILLFVVEFLTGSRSSLLPIIIIPIIYMLHHKPGKIIQYTLIFLFFITASFPFLPGKVQAYAEATFFFWDDSAVSKAEIHGSSKEGRLGQFEEALYAVNDNPILGRGFNYVAKHREDLPYGIGGSESIFLSQLINGGVLGLLAFIIFYFNLYMYLRRKCHAIYDKSRVDSLCISFFISICLTGITYTFFCVYLIFYMLTLYRVINNNSEKSVHTLI